MATSTQLAIVEQAMAGLSDSEKETFLEALKDVLRKDGVKTHSTGGYGQILGSIAPMVFATAHQKMEAIHLMRAWEHQSRTN